MITVVGLGFVGLTTALGFADKGFTVFGHETNQQRRNEIASGRIPFHEPFLMEKLAEHLGTHFLLVDDLPNALNQSDVVMLCVGTPSGDDGRADLGPINSALDEIIDAGDDSFRVLCVKSTVPPSTTRDNIGRRIAERSARSGANIGLANNPEFLREGFAWQDFIRPDRIVIGTDDAQSWEIMRRLYKPFGAPIHHVNLNTGEFIKYLSNTLLATMISFANELSMVGHSVGDVDIKKAFAILHQDNRWFGDPAQMVSYVHPGCGFGGYCLPKDTAALVGKSQENGHDPRLLRAVLEVNDVIGGFLADRVAREVHPGERIALLGLSFKPGSDDVRMTPAARMITALQQRGLNDIVAYDPLARDAFRSAYDFDIDYADSLELALSQAHAVVVVTAWREFIENAHLLQGKKVFDLRYCLPFTKAPSKVNV